MRKEGHQNTEFSNSPGGSAATRCSSVSKLQLHTPKHLGILPPNRNHKLLNLKAVHAFRKQLFGLLSQRHRTGSETHALSFPVHPINQSLKSVSIALSSSFFLPPTLTKPQGRPGINLKKKKEFPV